MTNIRYRSGRFDRGFMLLKGCVEYLPHICEHTKVPGATAET